MTLASQVKTALCLFFISTALPIPSLQAGEEYQCVTPYENGSVNWSTGTIQATGKASPVEKGIDISPDAIPGKAKQDARRNLIEILTRIAFEKESEGAPPPGDTIMAGIEKLAMDAAISEQHFTSDRAMEVTLGTKMFGGFLQLVLPEEIGEIPPLRIIPPREEADKPSEGKQYTGLIIDARGLGIRPVIYPVIVSEQGDEVYSARFISREYAVQEGVCQYVCTPDHPLVTETAGPAPLVIKGLRKGGKTNRFIVISRSDAETIEKTAERHGFMKQCRVVIVLDR
ncbi:MAG: hypothetical protein GY737_03725 [Desulfobacteraceae bacterium]|nr:hypothetical protein [Desulfobacteraceae bacterium]